MDRFHALGLFQLGSDGFHAFADDRSFQDLCCFGYGPFLGGRRCVGDGFGCAGGFGRFGPDVAENVLAVRVFRRFCFRCCRFSCRGSLFPGGRGGAAIFSGQVSRDDGGHISQGRLVFFGLGYFFGPACPFFPAGIGFLGRSGFAAGLFAPFPVAGQLLFLGFFFLFGLALTGQFGFFLAGLIGSGFFLVYLFHGFQDFIAGQDARRIEVIRIGALVDRRFLGFGSFFIDDSAIAADGFAFGRDKGRFFRMLPPFAQRHFRDLRQGGCFFVVRFLR